MCGTVSGCTRWAHEAPEPTGTVVTADPLVGLHALQAAADSGALGELCRRYAIRLLAVFGSVLDRTRAPRDLDVAVAFEPGGALDFIALVDELMSLTGVERLDVLDLGRAGPVARERALVGSLPLYETEPGVFARAQMAAITERMETEWLRRLDLELMSS
jgi:predicted nucleotidyltransferase